MIDDRKQDGLFTLSTVHTSYQMKVDADGRLLHVYYGPRTASELTDARKQHPDPGCWPNLLPMEYGAPGIGDHRIPAVVPEFADGTEAADFRFVSARAESGKYALPGMPAFYGDAAEAQTLRITLCDQATGLEAELLYGVLEQKDLITRTVTLHNGGKTPVRLRRASSLSMDFSCGAQLDWVTFDGAWAAERKPCRTPVRPGEQSVGSVCGVPAHAHNPFVMLCTPDATETAGCCWGFALVYSGNFLAQVEKSESGIRLAMGIHPYHFCWTLAPGESFTAPECAMVYSNRGFSAMSRSFHRAIRENLMRGRWKDMNQPHPVLINSWEAAYFDFDEERLVALARAAKKADIDLFVLDDGWFKGRNDDTTSLGDWTVDRKKLPNGIPELCRKINAEGLAFGIWVEPEAVSPDSDLYRAHPDWALQIPGRETLPIRHQYTLDFSRADVRDGIWQQLKALLDSCPIRYVKWDMNRSLADVYSAALPPERQGEVYHRYVLGLYDLQQRMVETYPDLLLENCSGGGARFDCGMLFYSPQIWCSDNTDAQDRLTIQYGTSFCYPPACMGAHFSLSPNQFTGRTASVEARMAAALSGTFGFELDLTKYSDAQLAELKPWIALYRAHGAMLRTADYYRLKAPDGHGAAWMFAAPDGSEAAVFVVGSMLDGTCLPLQGLEESAIYRAQNGKTCRGDLLMGRGLPLPRAHGDVPAEIWYFVRQQ
jgi:alpha-galactosidase